MAEPIAKNDLSPPSAFLLISVLAAAVAGLSAGFAALEFTHGVPVFAVLLGAIAAACWRASSMFEKLGLANDPTN